MQWVTQVGHISGSHKWFAQEGHTSGSHKWATQVRCTSGSHKVGHTRDEEEDESTQRTYQLYHDFSYLLEVVHTYMNMEE